MSVSTFSLDNISPHRRKQWGAWGRAGAIGIVVADGGPLGLVMVSGPSIDSDIGAGAGAGRRTQSGTGLNNNNMTNYFVYHQAVQWFDDGL